MSPKNFKKSSIKGLASWYYTTSTNTGISMNNWGQTL